MRLILLVLLLAACSPMKARLYDPVEYGKVVDVVVDATHAIHRCNSADFEYGMFVQQLNLNSFSLLEYVKNKDDSKEVVIAVTQLRQQVRDLTEHKVGGAYCVHKLSNIQASGRMIARALSHGSDVDVFCSSTVSDRYALFEKSYKNGLLTKEEFSDLVVDLVMLKKIDSANCTLENRVRFEKLLNDIQLAATAVGAL